jgi:hypothetical protein
MFVVIARRVAPKRSSRGAIGPPQLALPQRDGFAFGSQ